jgi:membrane protease YdiL (CAAX protease family)
MAPTGDAAPGAPRPTWLGTALYIPLLYGAGWLLVLPLAVLLPAWGAERLSLLGTGVAFALLLWSLPLRLRRVWGAAHPWRALGLARPWKTAGRAFLRGLLKALLLLLLITLVLLASGHGHWSVSLRSAELFNALALILGVGLAEELLFRGWLWGELALLLGDGARGDPRAMVLQAVLFSLVHTRFNLGPLASLGLLGGLLLLGLALALQRRADAGALHGAIGLHGGLVGGWFLLQHGLLTISPDTPLWLEGPGGVFANPLGGVVGWLGLGLLLAARRRWWGPQIPSGMT